MAHCSVLAFSLHLAHEKTDDITPASLAQRHTAAHDTEQKGLDHCLASIRRTRRSSGRILLVSISTMPATQNAGRSRPVPRKRAARHGPRLPRKTKVGVAKYHACHAKRRWMSPSTTPATQNAGRCRQVPCLPRKNDAASTATKRTQARHQTQPSPISATPATQNAGTTAAHGRQDGVWKRCVRWCDKDGVWKRVCERDVCDNDKDA